MILLTKGEFFTEGCPWKVSDTKKLAEEYLRANGYKFCKKDGLFTKVENGDSIWVRLNEIDKLKSRIITINTYFCGVPAIMSTKIIE